jgi:hypothetical protein
VGGVYVKGMMIVYDLGTVFVMINKLQICCSLQVGCSNWKWNGMDYWDETKKEEREEREKRERREREEREKRERREREGKRRMAESSRVEKKG